VPLLWDAVTAYKAEILPPRRPGDPALVEALAKPGRKQGPSTSLGATEDARRSRGHGRYNAKAPVQPIRSTSMRSSGRSLNESRMYGVTTREYPRAIQG